MTDCCKSGPKTKICTRKSDKKTFTFPRRFSKKHCLTKKIKGFTMRASCAPYKDCKIMFDVYTNQNPNNTISIKYKNYNDVKLTIKKLENLYKSKKYSHKRIWQVAMILMVRLRKLKNIKPKHYMLSKKYYNFLKNRTKLKENKRRRYVFTF